MIDRRKRAKWRAFIAKLDAELATELAAKRIPLQFRLLSAAASAGGKWDAIADRNPTGGDAQQAPSRSDESGGAGTAIAQPLPPYPSTD